MNNIMNNIIDQLLTLQTQVGDSLEPLVENTRPIWSDPLWQFLGLVLLCVVVIITIYVVLRFLGAGIASLFDGIKNIIIGFVLLLFGKMKNDTEEKPEDSGIDHDISTSSWLNRMSFKKAFDSVKHLTTKRDWRYQSSWYLLSSADKKPNIELIENINHHRRTHLLFREKQLISADTGWHFFDEGLVINIENPDSFSPAVDLISTYRPERTLDGVILTISANTLIEKQASDVDLKRYGQHLFQQLWQIQKTTGFIVPVYLVVTECEHVKGFDTF